MYCVSDFHMTLLILSHSFVDLLFFPFVCVVPFALVTHCFFFLMRVYKELISFHKELAFVSKHRGDIFVVGSMDFEQYICFHAINSETKSQFFSQVGWMDLNWTREKKDCCAICYSWPTSLNWSNRDVVKTRLFP